MQQSTYSIFNIFPWFQTTLQYAVSACSFNVPTSTQPPLMPVSTPSPICLSGKYYSVKSGDTCDSIAHANSVSTAPIFFGNAALSNCTTLHVGQTLCLPLTCQTYPLQPTDDCISASISAGVSDITLYNSWINSGCDNLHEANVTIGSVLCASPPGSTYVPGTPTNTSSFPGSELGGYGTS
jgi:LysM repeat protein